MSIAEKAAQLFHGEPLKCNCAQAVAFAFNEFNQEKFDEYKNYGGGRAKDGVCGALYATILERPDLEDTLKGEFKKHCGGLTCTEIKNQKFSCQEYVKIAAGLVPTK